MGRQTVARLDWSAGCGTFGTLMRQDGSHSLIETIWFSEREAAVVRLENGERQIIPWPTETAMLRTLSADVACDQVGMPPPPRIKVAGDWRRADPFHTERNRSARFRALITLIRYRQLPCRYSLLHFAQGERPGDFTGPCTEDPEQTAANVAERLARDRTLTIAAALRAELLDDALVAAADQTAAHALLQRAGWPDVLCDLDRELASHAPPAPPAIEPPPRPEPNPQLELFASRERPHL